jgi:hypothetical protein
MRKKSGFTIVEHAIGLVPEFENVVRKLDHQVELLLAVGYWRLAIGSCLLAVVYFNREFRMLFKPRTPNHESRSVSLLSLQ